MARESTNENVLHELKSNSRRSGSKHLDQAHSYREYDPPRHRIVLGAQSQFELICCYTQIRMMKETRFLQRLSELIRYRAVYVETNQMFESE